MKGAPVPTANESALACADVNPNYPAHAAA